MIGLIIFDFYLLYQIKNDQIFQISSVSVKNTNSINENLLKKITDLFDQKEKKTIELQTTPVIYPDPSL
jgi:Holliday junction resolvasome RuvABC ATP-dependent DNA helicase subunit